MQDFSGLSSRGTVYSVSDDYSGEFLTNPMVPEKYRKVQCGKVVFEKHSLVGAGSIILSGIILKEGIAVGTNSVIAKSTDEWSVYVGTPAKKLKNRKKDLLELEKNF